MGVVAIILALGVVQDAADSAPAPTPAAPAVQIPSEPAPVTVVAEPAPVRTFGGSRPLSVNRPEAGPSLGGFVFWSLAVIALLGGAFLLLKRFAGNSRILGGSPVLHVLARKPLGRHQEILLVEVGPRVLVLGSGREGLSTLAEFSQPDEVARLRARLPKGREESAPALFRESLKEGLREAEAPAPPAPPEEVYASLAGELAEIRKTVHTWKT